MIKWLKKFRAPNLSHFRSNFRPKFGFWLISSLWLRIWLKLHIVIHNCSRCRVSCWAIFGENMVEKTSENFSTVFKFHFWYDNFGHWTKTYKFDRFFCVFFTNRSICSFQKCKKNFRTFFGSSITFWAILVDFAYFEPKYHKNGYFASALYQFCITFIVDSEHQIWFSVTFTALEL